MSPLTSPNYATAGVAYTLPVPPPLTEPNASPASDLGLSPASLMAPGETIGNSGVVGGLL